MFTAEATSVKKTTGTALLLIDFQNEFTDPKGKLHDDVKKAMEANEMLSKIPKVVRKARDFGALVIHSPVVMKADQKFVEEFDVNGYCAMHGLFTENTWNSEFAKEVVPTGDDVILKNRTKFSAFGGTGLKEILESNSIKRIFLMGFLSNGCIEETARDMMALLPDMHIYMLKDGSAAKSEVVHLNATIVTLPMYGQCITCREAEKIIGGKHGAMRVAFQKMKAKLNKSAG